ncbi:MAG: TadE family protein [Parvularculaceae bacterium]|nr:TadE family protein [Parvularculaceae bacterium]
MRLLRSINRAARRARGALRDRSGSAAVEFSLVALPFLGLMMSTFEVGWFYFAASQVDAATVTTARLVRTGQVQKADFDKAEFFGEVCPHLRAFGDCDETLTVEVTVFNSFAALAADTAPVVCANDDPAKIAALAFQPGTDNSIVRLRVCLLYKTLNPTIGVNVAETADGKRRVFSSFIFQNEPYSRNNRTS